MEDTFSYDRLPYPSKFFVQTHPDRLATIATLFGMTPAPVASCRVLDLGCGNGSNLIAQAYLLPESRFVGVDLSKVHIDDANEAAKELGLTNVEFKQADVAEMTVAEYGKFDYVVAHGLFSWVPPFVRDAVLRLYGEFLEDNGVGYISYSAYPGAHHREMVQRMLRFQTAAFSEPQEKVGKALSFLSFLGKNTSDRGVYRSILQQEIKRHGGHQAADVFHDDLSDVNQPFYFHEFASLLKGAGLQFLGEAELHAMGTQNLSPDARGFLESIEDPVEREQYLDFLSGRIFRQTLFCRQDIKLNREIGPSAIDRFLVSSSLRPQRTKPKLAGQATEKFVGGNGVVIEIDQPLAKACLTYLGGIWGRAAAFPDLIASGKLMLERDGFAAEDWTSQTDIVRMVLMQVARASSVVELHIYQPAAFTDVSEMPAVNRLAHWQMKSADNILSLLGMDMKIEDRVSRRLLELLDGTRSRTDVIREMTLFIETADGIEGRKGLIRTLPDWVDESLRNLARIGVFEA